MSNLIDSDQVQSLLTPTLGSAVSLDEVTGYMLDSQSVKELMTESNAYYRVYVFSFLFETYFSCRRYKI